MFRQMRVGKGGHPFVLHKFRTMNDGRDSSGALLPDAVRLIPFGAWLRRLSLDELPQLWDVLRGDMSLVGPRPLPPQYLTRYTVEQRRRHMVKPGITGWAQVNGRNALTWEQKFEMDVWYVDNESLWLDIRILTMTMGQVIRGSGVSHSGHATMPEFLGSQERPRAEA
jgi:sugar transferase EpsL